MVELTDLISRTDNLMRRRILLAAWLAETLRPEGITPVVVGGCALEFYTTGGYTTGDLDLVCADHQRIGALLESEGFTKEGRHWIRPEWDLYVEVPGSTLSGDRGRFERVEIEGLTANVISREELLIDRLNALVHWNTTDEEHWVLNLIDLHGDDLDWKYIENRAKEEQTLARLGELRREAQR